MSIAASSRSSLGSRSRRADRWASQSTIGTAYTRAASLPATLSRMHISKEDEPKKKIRKHQVAPKGYSTFYHNIPPAEVLEDSTKLCIRAQNLDQLEMKMSRLSASSNRKKLKDLIFEISDYSRPDKTLVMGAKLSGQRGFILHHPHSDQLEYLVAHTHDNDTGPGVLGLLKHPYGTTVYKILDIDWHSRDTKQWIVEKAIFGVGEAPRTKSLFLEQVSENYCRSICTKLKWCKQPVREYRMFQNGYTLARFKRGLEENEFYTIEFSKRPMDTLMKTIAVGIGLILSIQKSHYQLDLMFPAQRKYTERDRDSD